MPRPISEAALASIEQVTGRHAGAVSAQQIQNELGHRIPLRTLQYRLRHLVDRQRLLKESDGRWAKYRLAAAEVLAPVTSPETARIILQAAADTFLDHGYDVSLDRIALAAGVTKPTIYSYFKDKNELFRAAMAGVAEEPVPRIDPPDINGNFRQELLTYARAFRAMVLAERQLLVYRAAVINVRERPGVRQLMLRGSLLRNNEMLTDFFREAVRRGLLRNMNAELLSEYFFAAVTGQARTKRLMGVEMETPEREEHYLQQMVDCFLAGTEATAPACGS